MSTATSSSAGDLLDLIGGSAAAKSEAKPASGPLRLLDLRSTKEPLEVLVARARSAARDLRQGIERGEFKPEELARIHENAGVLVARPGLINWDNTISLALADFLVDPCPQTAEPVLEPIAAYAYSAEARLARRAIDHPVDVLRDSFGLGIEQIAGLAGVTPATVKRWCKADADGSRGHKKLLNYAECAYWLREAGLERAEMRAWMRTPHEGLEGRTPFESFERRFVHSVIRAAYGLCEERRRAEGR